MLNTLYQARQKESNIKDKKLLKKLTALLECLDVSDTDHLLLFLKNVPIKVKRVLDTFVYQLSTYGKIIISNAQIAKNSGCSISEVKLIKAALQKTKIIKVEERFKRGEGNRRYQLANRLYLNVNFYDNLLEIRGICKHLGNFNSYYEFMSYEHSYNGLSLSDIRVRYEQSVNKKGKKVTTRKCQKVTTSSFSSSSLDKKIYETPNGDPPKIKKQETISPFEEVRFKLKQNYGLNATAIDEITHTFGVRAVSYAMEDFNYIRNKNCISSPPNLMFSLARKQQDRINYTTMGGNVYGN